MQIILYSTNVAALDTGFMQVERSNPLHSDFTRLCKTMNRVRSLTSEALCYGLRLLVNSK